MYTACWDEPFDCEGRPPGTRWGDWAERRVRNPRFRFSRALAHLHGSILSANEDLASAK